MSTGRMQINSLNVINFTAFHKVHLLGEKYKNAIRQAGFFRGFLLLWAQYMPRLFTHRYLNFQLAEKSSVQTDGKNEITVSSFTDFHQIEPYLEYFRNRLIYSNLNEFKRSFNKSATLWICSYRDKICGYCWSESRSITTSFATSVNDIYLYDVEIFIPFRRKEIGRKFISAVCLKFTANKFNQHIWCAIHQRNYASIKMFRNAGFELIG